MYTAIGLLVMGLVFVIKGDFKVGFNYRVPASIGRLLGWFVILGGLISLFFNYLWLPFWVIFYIIGVMKSEEIDPGKGPSRILYTIVTTVILVGGYLIYSDYLISIGLQEDPNVAVPASEINISSDDLSPDFVHLGEFNTNEDKRIKYTSERFFNSEDIDLATRVFVYKSIYPDPISSMRENLQEWILQSWQGNEIEFLNVVEVKLGERGILQNYFDKTTGQEGYELLFVTRNVVVFISAHCSPGSMSQEEIIDLGRLIEVRIE